MHIFSKMTNTILKISKEKEKRIMKNKKLIVVFILIVAFLLIMVTSTKASDDIGELPTIITNQDGNNAQAPLNDVNNEVGNTNIAENTNKNTANNNTLPQTGVQEDTTLFIFIGICIASASYAYFRIRKYNNIH